MASPKGSTLKENDKVLNCNIVDLFQTFSIVYFEEYLHNNPVIVEWSEKMTSCAGITYFKGTFIIIRLSKPLLKYRSLKELEETLLHEMIHAYLFLKGFQSFSDYITGGHGDVKLISISYLKCMKSIRKAIITYPFFILSIKK